MLKSIKTSNFFDFLQKVSLKKVNFTANNIINNQKTKIMCTYGFTDVQRKSLIYQMATLLLIGHSQTTNKDIKDRLHDVFPGINLTQAMVSNAMNELFIEKDEWLRDNTTSAGGWWVYTLKAQPAADSLYFDEVKDDCSTFSVNKSSQSSDISNLKAIATTGSGKSVSLGKIGLHPEAFLKSLDPKVKVAFAKGFEPHLLNTTNKMEARKLYKAVTGAKHNDVRMISVKTYLKRNNVK